MGRTPNDGRGRLGGRAKGTPNKPQPTFSDWADTIQVKLRPYIEGIANTPWVEGTQSIISAMIIAAAINNLTDAIRQTAPVEGLNNVENSTDAEA